MSGAISIPFQLLSILWPDTPQKNVFTGVAFAGLWIAAFNERRKSSQLADDHNKALKKLEDDYRQKILDLESFNKKSEEKIQKLEHQISDKSAREKMLSLMGEYHVQLKKRIREIQEMNPWDYCDKYREDISKKCFDLDTAGILNQIEAALVLYGSYALVAIFKDTTDMNRTPIEPGYATENMKMWQNVLDELNHRAKRLMKIIES